MQEQSRCMSFFIELTGSLAAKTEACSTFFCGAGAVSNIGRLGDEHVVWSSRGPPSTHVYYIIYSYLLIHFLTYPSIVSLITYIYIFDIQYEMYGYLYTVGTLIYQISAFTWCILEAKFQNNYFGDASNVFFHAVRLAVRLRCSLHVGFGCDEGYLAENQ